ncbi:hypothetical protein PMAYCL1PPCAC_04183 [Pristionchus mayeri]|uniref:RRM domain-containing protein n=1 Tax=Pristionchus mayeri TaxID=1317129 RepID=A0AAN4Z8K8_9BILA|nr:hypothetical protein PMAYCL1PPCAC_04183 [Pristionchus mayeri]
MDLPRLFLHNVDKKHHGLSVLDEYFGKYHGVEAITISSSPRNPLRTGMIRFKTIDDAKRVLEDGPVHTINGHDVFLTPREGTDENKKLLALTSAALKKKEEEEKEEKKKEEKRREEQLIRAKERMKRLKETVEIP